MTLVETKLDDWKKIFELNKYFLTPFVFRGQSNSDWILSTSIERTLLDFSKHRMGLLYGYDTEEKWMLHEFKKKYQLFSSTLPKQLDNFEWLAIMQHHGAPTRLLDFTESIFISMFFSVIDSKTDSAIWCVNRNLLRDLLFKRFNLDYIPDKHLKDRVNDTHIELANKFIAGNELFENEDYPNSIIPLEPNISTERLSKQQGLFLMPTNSKFSFFDNLLTAFNLSVHEKFEQISFTDLIQYSEKIKFDNTIHVLKIILPKHIHLELHNSLKIMNITAENLFPGIDGLARSLIHSHILT